VEKVVKSEGTTYIYILLMWLALNNKVFICDIMKKIDKLAHEFVFYVGTMMSQLNVFSSLAPSLSRSGKIWKTI
jgi:hypothetical protein